MAGGAEEIVGDDRAPGAVECPSPQLRPMAALNVAAPRCGTRFRDLEW
jgi:hypothetical protein